MDISLEVALETATVIAAVAGAYAVTTWRLDRSDKDFEQNRADVWREVGKLREWRHTHEKESSDKRLEIAGELSAIKSDSVKNEAQVNEIMRLMEKMDGKVDKLFEKFDRFLERKP